MEEAVFSVLKEYILFVEDLELLNLLRGSSWKFPILCQLAKVAHNCLFISLLIFHSMDGRFIETAFGEHLLIDDEVW